MSVLVYQAFSFKIDLFVTSKYLWHRMVCIPYRCNFAFYSCKTLNGFRLVSSRNSKWDFLWYAYQCRIRDRPQYKTKSEQIAFIQRCYHCRHSRSTLTSYFYSAEFIIKTDQTENIQTFRWHFKKNSII